MQTLPLMLTSVIKVFVGEPEELHLTYVYAHCNWKISEGIFPTHHSISYFNYFGMLN